MTTNIPLRNCSTSWRLSAFADEATSSIDGQIVALQRAGFKHIDPRGIAGHNISALPIDIAKDARAKLDAAGIVVNMLGSPLGKIDIGDPMDSDMAKLEHLAVVGDILGCKAVRIFSYYNKKNVLLDEWKHQSFARLRQLLDRANQLGLVLYHENESHIYGDPVYRNVEIAKEFRGKGAVAPDGSLRMIFDFGNYLNADENAWDAWEALRDYHDAFHLKELDVKKQHVPIGTGIGQTQRILTDAISRGWHGSLSLEPHLAHSPAVLATGPTGIANQSLATLSTEEVFHVAAQAAKVLMGQVKATVI